MSAATPTPSTSALALPDWSEEGFSRARYRAALEADGLVAALGVERRTYDALIGRARNLGYALAYVEEIAAAIGRSARTVLRDLKALQAKGFIVVDDAPIIRRGDHRPGHRNRYWMVHPDRIATLVRGLTHVVAQVVSTVEGTIETARATARKALSRAGKVSPPNGIRSDRSVTSHPVRPFTSKEISLIGRKEEDARTRATAAADPSLHHRMTEDARALANDAEARLCLDTAANPDLAAQLSRDAAALLRRHPDIPLDEWLRVQAWDLSGYGLDFWRDKIYTPRGLAETRALWRLRGRPVFKSDRRLTPRPGQPARAPRPHDPARWEPGKIVDIAVDPRECFACCGLRFVDGHRFDCAVSPGGPPESERLHALHHR